MMEMRGRFRPVRRLVRRFPGGGPSAKKTGIGDHKSGGPGVEITIEEDWALGRRLDRIPRISPRNPEEDQ
jgi:hypothetical protein